MTETIDYEGFRACVGLIVSRGDGEVLWARCIRNRGWQFPQGGIEIGETAEEAAYRELHEEVGLGAEEVRILGRTENWLYYRLPQRYQRKNTSPRCVGQKQIWFVVELTAPEDSICLNAVGHPEFDRWRWVDWWHAVGDVIFFKRKVYDRALTELAPWVFPVAPPPRPQHDGQTGRWRAPRSPYRIKKAAPRQESRSRAGRGRATR
ncbi:MAG: RNA pyrophosphohydrolase [Gammaproteobacteria bacterium]|nr:RNA pyrophosphohydrolase [Gammaproteobacteria bacterium]